MKIVVYCSAADHLPQPWVDAARTVGNWIGQNGCQLVYGGVEAGLMTVTAQAVKDAGGHVVGVVPACKIDQASPLNDVQVPTADLNDRKSAMQTLGDVFVVLPGGYGTLDEFASTFAYLNFTGRRRPIIIFNADGLYSPLLRQLDAMQSNGLLRRNAMELIHVANTAPEIIVELDKTLRQ